MTFSTIAEIDSGIEKRYVVSFALPTAIKPGFNDTNGTAPATSSISTLKVIDALAAVLDLGTYPMFRAKETTFSRNVAESRKDSFATRFALKALI